MVRTIEEIFGLSPLLRLAASATSLQDLFGFVPQRGRRYVFGRWRCEVAPALKPWSGEELRSRPAMLHSGRLTMASIYEKR